MPASLTSVENYWDSRPCNVRHSDKPIGTWQYFNEVERKKYFVESHIPQFAEFGRWRRVLEIGCGIGTDTMNFARYGAFVTALDLSGVSLAIARSRAKVCGVADNIQFIQGNAEHLCDYVSPGGYDLIYSFGVIHHTPDPERVLREMRCLVSPATSVRIMVYNRRSWKVLGIILRYWKWGEWDIDKLVARHSEAQEGCPVTHTYSRRKIRRMLKRCGFAVESIKVEHIFPYSIPEYNRGEYRKTWIFRWMPTAMFRGVQKLLGWHLCIIARSA